MRGRLTWADGTPDRTYAAPETLLLMMEAIYLAVEALQRHGAHFDYLEVDARLMEAARAEIRARLQRGTRAEQHVC